MYLDFFRLTEKPFTITPNPRFLFLSKIHKEAFAHLFFGIRNRCGFVEMTGEVGTGKTTVLRTLLNQLGEEDYRLALIFNPSLSALDLLRSINREYGIAADGNSAEELLSRLNDYLLQENRAGRTVVLVIDEAQNLDPGVLEQIRLLSNLETETDKLIQIILVGQPELGEVLDRSDLRQLSQRIAVRYHLRAMDHEDTRAYLSHRLTVAGGAPEMFTPGAIRKIYAFSGGLPRLINILCDRALVVGYADGQRRITARMVRTAVRELRREREAPVLRQFWPVLTAVALVFGGLGFYIGEHEPEYRLEPLGAKPPAVAASLAPAGRPPAALPPADVQAPLDATPTSSDETAALQDLRRWLGGLDEKEALTESTSALQRVWRMDGEEGLPVLKGLGDFSRTLKRKGMHLALFRGDLDGLLKLDSPALLEVLLPGVTEPRYIALTGRSGGNLLITPSPEVGKGLDRDLLGRLWSGRAFVPWMNYEGIPPLGVPGKKGKEVAVLQRLLHRAGVYEGEANGIYDRDTIAAVTRFQARRGIVQDGRVGPRTLLVLYQNGGSFGVPTISGGSAGDEG